MDWQQRMTAALDYLETCVTETFSVEEAGRRANCSPFHFMRMFEIVTGITPAEYIRRRRLSRAAIDLASGQGRVLDIALRYGYDSPDSFSRAFKREYDCLPSEAKRPGTRLHNYPPLTFTIALKGEKAMEYRIEKGEAIRLTGIDLKVNNREGKNLRDVPQFWETAMKDGRYAALCKKAGPKLGMCGVCRDFVEATGDFVYSIAIETPADRSGLPADSVDFVVPASTWAKFTARGPLHTNLQDTLKRIWSEWFPTSGREHAGTAELEYYSDGDPNAADYWCEYWMPLK